MYDIIVRVIAMDNLTKEQRHKNMVNIKQMDQQSHVITRWTEADPESHFDREKAGGENFRILPALFSVGREAEE